MEEQVPIVVIPEEPVTPEAEVAPEVVTEPTPEVTPEAPAA